MNIWYVCACKAGSVAKRETGSSFIVNQKLLGWSGPLWNRKPIYEYIRLHIHIV